MIIQNGDNNTKVQIFHRISYQIIDSPFEIWEWICNFIPDFTGHVITYPCWVKSLNHVSKMAPDCTLGWFNDNNKMKLLYETEEYWYVKQYPYYFSKLLSDEYHNSCIVLWSHVYLFCNAFASCVTTREWRLQYALTPPPGIRQLTRLYVALQKICCRKGEGLTDTTWGEDWWNTYCISLLFHLNLIIVPICYILSDIFNQFTLELERFRCVFMGNECTKCINQLESHLSSAKTTD